MKINIIEGLRISDAKLAEFRSRLEALGHELIYYPEASTDPQELLARCQEADVVILANHPLPAEVVNELEQTQLIAVAFTGTDHVAQEAVKQQGIKLVNAAGYSINAVPELSLALCLALSRHLIPGHLAIQEGANFRGPIQGREIYGKTVGIIGTGQLGLQTAKLYQALGAKVIGYNRSEKAEALEMGLTYVDLANLYAESDIISIHLPLTKETKGLINDEAFDQMKESAYVINVARGPIIDTEALAAAIKAGKIAGAGIDVFDQEPPLADQHPLFALENVILSPHVGYLTDEAMNLRAEIIFAKVEQFLKGEDQTYIIE